LSKRILILGAGSVGKRHAKNLIDLGCEVSLFDPRQDRVETVRKELDVNNAFSDQKRLATHLEAMDGVVIASPPKFHLEQASLAVQRDLPVLMEKPLSISADQVTSYPELIEKQATILMGYTYRWWGPLGEMKKRLGNNELGKIWRAEFIMSAHLADWHPWENYQDFFMASKELGGGALLDESHFVDLMLWLFGEPDSLFADIDKLSNLEIDTDDNVDIVARYKDGLRVSIHLDLFGRPHRKHILISGENGSMEWSFEPNRLRTSNTIGQEWSEQFYTCERNEMFIAVAKEFLDHLENNTPFSSTLNDGLAVLKILDLCRKSSLEKKCIRQEASK